jgi:transcriptional regulator GlxA family with amidase domain
MPSHACPFPSTRRDVDRRIASAAERAAGAMADGHGDAARDSIAALLAGRRASDPRLERALTLLHAAPHLPIAAIAAHARLSTRQIDRAFDRFIGVPPKQLARVARFRRAFELGMSGGRGGWASIAAACGYADQAHLCRDFIEFAEASPEALRASLTAPV